MVKYSIVIPVFNRPDEVEELLNSLAKQRYRNFEIVIIEDGSTEPCKNVVDKYSGDLTIRYFFKENTGPGLSRNFGMEKAEGEYIILFDSDCLIPEDYLEKVEEHLAVKPLDAWGGPDAAHPSFSDTQKAIDYAMTSFFTTGGIRGKASNLDKFQPRSFNMGFKKEIYNKIGGFSNVHPGEDPEFSYKIMDAGFVTGLIPNAKVFHKRRIDFGKFIKQVYKFSVARIFLTKWFPEKFKIVYLFPSLFLLGSLGLIAFAILIKWHFLFPFGLLILLLFTDALVKTKKINITLLAIYASLIQLTVYGFGFLKAFFYIFILRKDERKAFPKMFF